MNHRLLLSIAIILGLSSYGISANGEAKGLTQAQIDKMAVQIKANSGGGTINMNLTIDEAAKAFGTPSRKEMKKEIEKKEKKKRFWSILYATFFVDIPVFICSIFTK